ncbi:MAG: cytochrome c [Deltaproteobacteria bacterium]
MKKIFAALLVASALPAWGAPPNAADGAAVYQKHCAMCHGAGGKGDTGVPPITGKSTATVAKVAAAHPPPADKLQITPDDAASVGRYVSSLKK